MPALNANQFIRQVAVRHISEKAGQPVGWFHRQLLGELIDILLFHPGCPFTKLLADERAEQLRVLRHGEEIARRQRTPQHRDFRVDRIAALCRQPVFVYCLRLADEHLHRLGPEAFRQHQHVIYGRKVIRIEDALVTRIQNDGNV